MPIYYLRAIIEFYDIKGNNFFWKNQLKLDFIMILLLNFHQSLCKLLQDPQWKQATCHITAIPFAEKIMRNDGTI
jgi:hypothetical protein